jgi:hypothetical protein
MSVKGEGIDALADAESLEEAVNSTFPDDDLAQAVQYEDPGLSPSDQSFSAAWQTPQASPEATTDGDIYVERRPTGASNGNLDIWGHGSLLDDPLLCPNQSTLRNVHGDGHLQGQVSYAAQHVQQEVDAPCQVPQNEAAGDQGGTLITEIVIAMPAQALKTYEEANDLHQALPPVSPARCQPCLTNADEDSVGEAFHNLCPAPNSHGVPIDHSIPVSDNEIYPGPVEGRADLVGPFRRLQSKKINQFRRTVDFKADKKVRETIDEGHVNTIYPCPLILIMRLLLTSVHRCNDHPCSLLCTDLYVLQRYEIEKGKVVMAELKAGENGEDIKVCVRPKSDERSEIITTCNSPDHWECKTKRGGLACWSLLFLFSFSLGLRSFMLSTYIVC